jgi:hypothetical protein
LYYYRPCPEDFTSPLFARQYEKVKINPKGELTGDQFHRLHPLKKEGLDLEHFHWVRWTTNGDVERCEYPEEGYHGKDYWVIPPLSGKVHRSTWKDYSQGLERLLDEYGISKPVPFESGIVSYETEFKLAVPGTEPDVHAVFDLIDEKISMAGFKIRDYSKRSQLQEDVYFDDPQLTLYKNGSSFRLRKKKNNLRVTLKKRFCTVEGKTDGLLYERIEEEATITPKQRDALIKDAFGLTESLESKYERGVSILRDLSVCQAPTHR